MSKNSKSKGLLGISSLIYKRLGSYLIDYLVLGVLTGLPGIIIYHQLGLDSNGSFKTLALMLEAGQNWLWITYLFGLLISLIYLLLLPTIVWPGQTLGQKLMKLSTTTVSGGTPSFLAMFIRNIICLSFIEGASFLIGSWTRDLMFIYVSNNLIAQIIYYLWLIATMASAGLLLFRKDERALHDLIAGTKVVEQNN